MNHRNENASFMDINVTVIAIILWAFSFAAAVGNRDLSVFPLIFAFLVLFLEKRSRYLRNHAGQIAVLNIAIFVINLIIGIIQTVFISVLGWIVLVGPTAVLIFTIINIVLSLIYSLYHIFGIAKAGKFQYCKLPLIGFFGDMLEQAITSK
ncbi:DUF4870 domain-containing protein [Erysipelothrix amsterdamensis]|uniref:DUF4870 domain-containing protein n=1 Tax=Erysipelothrix amsterdamensis TaxID=2929157 RepID=A0AAU9VIW8_9FIRM|nr:DUF4870 domain-containing protein [Erysipelothrix sp. A18Y020d]CAH2761327.1 DUF4870 domain-containing protein [Erysipelothrix sp. A18Y020d]